MSKPISQPIDDERFAQVQYRASDLMGRFTVPHLRAVYHAFDGDMILCLVVGEIALRNMGRYFDDERNAKLPESRLDDSAEREQVMRPCNALSIADSTGIPRETVRRKVALALERGWVHRNARGHLYLTQELARDFMAMTRERIEEMIATGRALEALLLGEECPPRSRSSA